VDIKKICGYPHNRYLHGYGYGYEENIYPTGRVRGSYYLYPTHPVDIPSGSIVLVGKRVNNIYLLNLHHASFSIHCLLTEEDDTWLWHRRLCHIHMHLLNRLNRKQLVEGLPKLKFENDRICETC